MKKILIVTICVFLSCAFHLEDGTVHHYKSNKRGLTKYYVKIKTKGYGCATDSCFYFIDKTGKYEIGDRIVYMKVIKDE